MSVFLPNQWYSDMASTPNSCARRRMLTASIPCSSAMATAFPSTSSRLKRRRGTGESSAGIGMLLRLGVDKPYAVRLPCSQANLTAYGRVDQMAGAKGLEMKAIVQTGYGAPAKVLKLEDVDKPEVDADRVLVRVRATSVNSGDCRQVIADPFIVRIMSGFRRPRDPIVGGDVAGIVEWVGEAVTDLKPGDEVFGVRSGAFAEYVAARFMVEKPANLTFEQAAAIPV